MEMQNIYIVLYTTHHLMVHAFLFLLSKVREHHPFLLSRFMWPDLISLSLVLHAETDTMHTDFCAHCILMFNYVITIIMLCKGKLSALQSPCMLFTLAEQEYSPIRPCMWIIAMLSHTLPKYFKVFLSKCLYARTLNTEVIKLQC